MAQLKVLVFQNQAPDGVLWHWPMLVIHQRARYRHYRRSYAVSQRQYSHAQQRVILSPGSRNDLGKEGGIDKINGHPQPKKGQKANDGRLERELKDIHMVSFAFLAWEPDSLLVFPDHLQLWSSGSRTSELVPFCRVVSHWPGTFHSSSSTAAIPKNGQGCSLLPHLFHALRRLLRPGRRGLCVSALSFPLFCYPHSSGRSSVSNPFRNYSPKEPHAVAATEPNSQHGLLQADPLVAISS